MVLKLNDIVEFIELLQYQDEENTSKLIVKLRLFNLQYLTYKKERNLSMKIRHAY